ncbi:MAG: fimbria/pilus outer membrane usher protein, partial [Gallionella sp.]|nr:fimbria/pilus outer membrane usher protein [Gallionella sp.]
RQSLRNSVSIQAQGASLNFRQFGQAATTAPIKMQLAGNWSHSFENSRSFGIGFTTFSRYDDTRVSTVSGNYAMRTGERNSLNFTASRAIAGASGTSLGAFFVMPLGNSRIVSASANSHAGQQDFYVSAIQSTSHESNLGWRALAGRQQDQSRAEGGAYYMGNYGRLSGDVSASPDQTAVRLGANGGLVLADKTLFATQRVDQSFAVAEVAGYGDVGIGLGGNMLTRTNANGVALVPRLMPYQNNPIRLDPGELPVSAEIGNIEQNAVPAWRSAVKVTFPVRGGRGALLKIVFDDGEVAPAGATVQIEGDKEEFYVARRGEAFVTGLQPANRVLLNWKGQQCKFDVTLPPEAADEIPRLGPLLCKGATR